MVTYKEVDNLKVKIFNTRTEMGQQVAKEVKEIILQLAKEKEEINMIFAAAPSQQDFLEVFKADKDIPFEKINAFHMDEYIGLSDTHPAGFGNFLRERLFGCVPFKNVYYINGGTTDIDEECKRYAEVLREHPIDIVCLGIGENGHIAFNDPHVAYFDDQEVIKKVELDQKCRMQQVNDGCFMDIKEVPVYALTLTIPTLMNSSYHFCIVPAKTKAQAVYDTLYGKIEEACPATILRNALQAVLYLDQDSSELIKG